jgi:DNA-binding MarR family transcriptional regulator
MKYEDCLHFLVAKAFQKVSGLFRSRLQHIGVTPPQALVLMTLYEDEGISAGELGERLVFDSPTTSGILDRMEKDDWIVKKIAPNDGRLLQLYLTDKARNVKKELLSELESCNQEALSSFKLEEKILFERFLRDLRK